MLGNIELAALRTRDQSVLGILKSAGTAAERGAKLTGQLLAFARKQHLAPRVVSLNELVSSMGDLLLQTIGVTIRIETVLEKDLWAVMIDPTQLELVILNLAINSRDAMPNGGRLTVATKNIGVSDRHRPAGLAEREYVAISVSDTGSGMTQEVAAKAFEPFFTTKSVGQGTGLGLSQVLGFAQQSGGEVRIDSRVGQGTTITIFLPRSRESLTRAVDEARPVPHDGKAATILVVDDDADVRELTVSALEAMNYRVLAAENGRVALDVLRQADTVDLAVIDLVMPVMNGRQLATRIRAADPGRAILFMTGYDDLSGTDDPFAQEMVIKKPFKLVELAAAVERALADTRWRTPGMERDANPPAEEDMIERLSNGPRTGIRALQVYLLDLRTCYRASRSSADLVGTDFPSGSYRDRHGPPLVVDRTIRVAGANNCYRSAYSAPLVQ